MKKIKIIGLIVGMIILISSNSNAQYLYTSFGYAQNWRLPTHIEYNIQDSYFGYDIAHVQRYMNHGYNNYNVLLHRNGLFLEIRFDRNGQIYKSIRHNYYPLISHRCTNYCGYNYSYYKTYYPTYHHTNYVHKRRNTVYVNTHNRRQNNNYYTNVHVEKKKKKQNHYSSNQQNNRQKHNSVNTRTNSSRQRSNSVIRQPQQDNRQSQHNVKSRTNNQQQRSNSVTRKPQRTNSNIEHIRSQGSSKRIQNLNSQRASGRSNNGNKPKSLMAYKNKRGKRGH